jgi:O-antigen/teichoic acid export membrane protein
MPAKIPANRNSTEADLKRTVKVTGIYGIGNAARGLTAIIMLPIYTRFLTPADYGVVELLTMMLDLAGVFAALQVAQAMVRYYVMEPDPEQRGVIASTTLLTTAVVSSLLVGVIAVSSSVFARVLFGDPGYVLEIELFALSLFQIAIVNTGFAYIRALQKPWVHLTVSLLQLALQVSANLAFVVYYEMHVLGVILASLTSGYLLAAGMAVFVVVGSGLRFSPTVSKRLIRFVAPLILAGLGSLYMAVADRYSLRVFWDLSAVGIYSLGRRVGYAVHGVLNRAIFEGWNPRRLAILKQDNALVVYQHTFRLITTALVSAGVLVSIFAKDFLNVMSAPAFHGAAVIVPIAGLAALARGLTLYCNLGIVVSEKTRHSAEAGWIAAACMTAGLFVLVPAFGIVGAALCAFLGRGSQLFWTERKARQYYDMQLPWRHAFVILGCAAAAVLAGEVAPDSLLTSVLVRSLVFASYLLAIYCLPFWSADERAVFRAIMRAPRTAVRRIIG